MCCAALQHQNFRTAALSPIWLSPLPRNHLRGLFQRAKALVYDSISNNAQKQAKKIAHCVSLLHGCLWRPPPAPPLHTHNQNSLTCFRKTCILYPSLSFPSSQETHCCCTCHYMIYFEQSCQNWFHYLFKRLAE